MLPSSSPGRRLAGSLLNSRPLDRIAAGGCRTLCRSRTIGLLHGFPAGLAPFAVRCSVLAAAVAAVTSLHRLRLRDVTAAVEVRGIGSYRLATYYRDRTGMSSSGRSRCAAGSITFELRVTANLITVARCIVLHFLFVSINRDITVADVDIVPVLDMRAGTADPSPTFPTMVVDSAPVPVAIAVQPCADREPDAKVNEPVIRRRGFSINRQWVILGN